MKIRDIADLIPQFTDADFLCDCFPLSRAGHSCSNQYIKKKKGCVVMKKGLKVLERVSAVSLPVIAVAANAVTSFAAETGAGGSSLADTATSALTAAVTDMASSVASAIGAIIPIAIPLVGAGLVVTIGLMVFTKITNKA